MNLNDFLNAGKKKSNFKVVISFKNTKLTRFVSALTDDDAKSAIASEMKKDHPGISFKIKEIKNLSQISQE